jgi:hypothetical protein
VIHRHNGKSHAGSTATARRVSIAPGLPVADVAATRDKAETWIAEHPVACVAAALALGATLGWLIKRR